jgi:3-deoxy-D-arabino-heptulosonate 7-phosphate (DAHP) synthase
MIEVHNKPDEALSDGFQSLYLHQLKELLPKLGKQAELMGRKVSLQQKSPEIV